MRDLWIVLKFEFFEMIKKKGYILSTVFLGLLTFALAVSPMIWNQSTDKPTSEVNQGISIENAGYVLNQIDAKDKEILINLLKIKGSEIYDSVESLTKDLKNEKIQIGFEVESLNKVKTHYFNRGMASEQEPLFLEIVKQIGRSKDYGQLGVDINQINEIEARAVENEVIILGRDSLSNYFITYFMSFAIYMLVILYGSTVATAIAREKDDRTMELLVTSTKPSNLIIGKVFGVGLGTLLQVSFFVVCGLIGFLIAKDYYPEMIQLVFKTSLTWDLILIYIFYYLFGFILYLFVFSAVGSSVSRVEDVSSAMGPIMFLIMAAVFVSMFSFADSGGWLNKIAATLPFTSFLVMPTRYIMSVVPMGELLISMFMMLFFVGLFAWISMKIYRWGTLYYGNKVSLIKMVKEALSRND